MQTANKVASNCKQLPFEARLAATGTGLKLRLAVSTAEVHAKTLILSSGVCQFMNESM